MITVIVACIVLLGISGGVQSDETQITHELLCTLDGKEYIYTIVCDEQYQIIEAGGHAWIADHVQVEQYDDANILMAQIEDYFEDRGGTCEIAEIVSLDKE